MARRKNNSTSAVAPLPSSSLALDIEMDPELQALIDQQARATGAVGGWPFISTRGGIFSRGDVELESFNAVVLVHARTNQFYAGQYDASKRSSPDCFAIQGATQTEAEMGPPEDLKGRESEKCLDCEQNVFGSDHRGKGKACKNVHTLALLLFDGEVTAETVAKAPGYRLSIPPTSKKWSEVVSILTTKNIPIALTTLQFTIEDDDRTQFQVIPFPTGVVKDKAAQRALLDRVEEADTQCRAEPPRKAATDKPARRVPRKKTGKKKTVRRRSQG